MKIISSKKEQIHVVPSGDSWVTKKPHAKRASSKHKTQNEARQHAIKQAKKHGNTEVKIHRKDGKIRESNTYNRKDDPRKTKG